MNQLFVLERLVGPDIEPVTLAEIRSQVREFDDVTANDSDLSALVTAGREWVEDYTGRALIDQTWRITLPGRTRWYLGSNSVTTPIYPSGFGWFGAHEWLHWFRVGEILLRKAPIIAITAFVSVDTAGAETAVDSTTYELREKDSKWPRIVPLSGAAWPSSDLRITFRAGFADRLGSPTEGSEVVPTRFKQAIRLWVEANFDRDEKMMPLLLTTAENLIKSERSELSMA